MHYELCIMNLNKFSVVIERAFYAFEKHDLELTRRYHYDIRPHRHKLADELIIDLQLIAEYGIEIVDLLLLRMMKGKSPKILRAGRCGLDYDVAHRSLR